MTRDLPCGRAHNNNPCHISELRWLSLSFRVPAWGAMSLHSKAPVNGKLAINREMEANCLLEIERLGEARMIRYRCI